MNIKKLITFQDSADILSKYFSEVRHFLPLTKEEERELIIKIQKEGSALALDKLIKHNLKFVITVAKQYQGQGAPLMDLISQGNEGLIEAARRFDIKHDIKFFSYAIWWIRIKMFTTIDLHKRVIQLPANRELLVQKIKQVITQLEQDFQRPPTLEETTIEVNKQTRGKKAPKHSIHDVYEAIINCTVNRSLSDPVPTKSGQPEDSYTMESVLQGDMSIDETDNDESLSRDLNRYMTHMNQIEYDVLCLSIGLNGEGPRKTLDIARALKIKEKDVIKYKTRGLNRLRQMNNIESLKDYL